LKNRIGREFALLAAFKIVVGEPFLWNEQPLIDQCVSEF
jgi:hypothetical protein